MLFFRVVGDLSKCPNDLPFIRIFELLNVNFLRFKVKFEICLNLKFQFQFEQKYILLGYIQNLPHFRLHQLFNFLNIIHHWQVDGSHQILIGHTHQHLFPLHLFTVNWQR
jgi:hypothetical protein